ncbi:hypothetical protein C5167_014059 [Papaver somniferum]|uniref:Thaumatin-like protein n=1 Tax=Papaver somniferum TaxID=3469 RepID=A0A4Y7J656_PAPSO|nr:thaumatin-like protein 1b [Papaver somniferum]RZC55209.1 hypothetical protein C5167_014059 [Papaver somniferum]
MGARPVFLSLTIFIIIGIQCVYSTTFTFTNYCSYTVWPGLLASSGSPPLENTGFVLQKGGSKSISAPTSWSGRFWGRTLCTQDSTTGKFTCVTGDCGSGQIECAGRGAVPPATLAEFTLNGSGGLDFYDVSLVDGYNIQMLVVPKSGSAGTGNCNTTGCLVDLNGMCPTELKVLSSDSSTPNVACKSACEAFGEDQYCCKGAYANPDTCHPSSYSEIFKHACPRAYSYAYDDGTSTFTCASSQSDYLITFCQPSANSQKSSNYPEAAMYFMGNDSNNQDEYDTSIASSTRLQHGDGRILLLVIIIMAVAISFCTSNLVLPSL